MTKTLTRICLVCLCCLFVGCAAQSPAGGGAAAPAAAPAADGFAIPAAPAGMLLGASYVSALNESCYELLPASGSFEPAQALCLRGGTWHTVPPVRAPLPGKMPGPAR